MASEFTGRVGIIQRVLAFYRKPFFEKLATVPGLSLSVFAGQPLPGEGLQTAETLEIARYWRTINHYFQGPAGFVCWQFNVLAWLRDFAPDVLIVEANPRLLSNWLAVLWMKRRRRPVLGWGLGELSRSGPPWLRHARGVIARSLIRSMDAMIAYSSKAAHDYVNVGISGDKVFIAYNAIDNEESEHYLRQFGSDTTWIKPWKEFLQFDPELPIILYVGRLIPPKRVDLLIQACAPLLDRCQLLVVGDGPMRAELEALALLYGDRIRFVGHQSGENLAKCFIASDIFVLPGSGGLAIHQAMSYRKSVIASFGDGTEADFIHEGANGFFFHPGDMAGLRERISALIAQPHSRRAMGEASLAIVRHEINIEAMVDTFSRALAAVTNRALRVR